MSRYEICLSGSGGQGMILCGKILAEGIAIYQGKFATQTQSYGPEARGGASRSEVVVSDEQIDYPKVTNLDLLLALTQESLNKYLSNLKDGGILIIDPFGVKNIPLGKYKVYEIKINDSAKAELGKTIYGNIIALGAISSITKIVSLENLAKAVEKNVPEKTREQNKIALEIGFKMGQDALR
ncbi:2-oxoacid:acceptor oxidoreductase family protein [Candidatus Saganbacteria bacterium]|nr:2-oxoacid:acceptor oxidoreductase family protein [Candidatus Saganbacteria bacterium]